METKRTSFSIDELFDLIDEPNRTKCLKLFDDHKEKMVVAPGSKTKHQAWEGGYIDHLEETMNFGIQLWLLMNAQRSLSFTLSDVGLILFLHDLEKPFKYMGLEEILTTTTEKFEFILEMVHIYRIKLTAEHLNAIKYAHGEGDDYHPTKRVQGPLAAFIHMCDVASARIWHDYPKLEEERM